MRVLNKTNRISGLLFLIFFVLCSSDALFAKDGSKVGLINCDIQQQSCIQPLSGGSVTLEILPKPVTAMNDLTFEIKVTDLSPKKPPFIDLGMPGMKMGPNRVLMQETSMGVYQGSGIIVRCPSGKTVWQASVHLPGIGSVDFVFDVIY